jgi:4-methyl-5(b-hydroxyethyl)-thiazole monophosphate biosynthesis
MNYPEAIASEYLKTASPLCPLSTSGEGKRFAGVRQKSKIRGINSLRFKRTLKKGFHMNKHAIIILADGFEEVEAITPVDLLRRAGIAVTMLGLTSMEVNGSHNITVKAEMLLNDFNGKYDALVLPGGPGHKNLLESHKVLHLVNSAFQQKLLCAAICAAPSIFGKAGILKGKKATCFPGYEDKLGEAIFIQENVVRDANVITSRGAGTAVEFGLEIIDYLIGKAEAENVSRAIQFNR